MRDLTVIAVDWSGAAGAAQTRGIRTAVIHPDGDIDVWFDMTRDDVFMELDDIRPPVVAGFDFSFGYPAWVGRWHGIDFGPDLWPVVHRNGEQWLASCPSPFFGHKGTTRPDAELLRNSERRHRAKSSFQIAGAGHVGTGTIRGMPYLTEARSKGYAIWPFEDAGPRTIIEIYPAVLRGLADISNVPSPIRRAMRRSNDTRDAVSAALAMADRRDQLATLARTTDATTLVEGDIWTPAPDPRRPDPDQPDPDPATNSHQK